MMYKLTATAAITLTLVGCGGGSGDSPTSNSLRVFSPTSELNVTGNTMRSVFAQVDIDSSGVVRDGANVYVGVLEDSAGIVSSAEMVFLTEDSGFYLLNFHPGYRLPDGNNQSRVSFGFCYDQYCNEHVNGSPISVDINYSNDLSEQISLSENSPKRIDKSAVLNATDIANPSAEFMMSVEWDNLEPITFRYDNDYQIVSHLAVEEVGDNDYRLSADIRLPTSLKEGDHASDLVINACYDANCDFPIKGSPITIPMTYQVTAPVFEADSPAAVSESQNLPFDVQEAKHVPGLDIIVMLSHEPEYAVYVYDIASNETFKYPLSEEPTDFMVDIWSQQGRIIVAHPFLVTQIDYNPNDPANPTVTVHDTSSSSPRIVVNKDEVYLMDIYPSRLDLNTSIQTDIEHFGFGRDFVVVERHPNGHGFYASDRDRAAEKYKLNEYSNIEWVSYASERADDTVGQVFFSYDGSQLFTANGSIFTTSPNRDEDMRYVGSLPKAEPEGDLYAVVQNETFTVLADDSPGNTVRKLNNLDMSVMETYPGTYRTFDAGTADERVRSEWPMFAFISDRGYIFTIKVASDYQSGVANSARHYRLERLE